MVSRPSTSTNRAFQAGNGFDRKWVGAAPGPGEPLLGTQTSNPLSNVSIVRDMSLVPVSLRGRRRAAAARAIQDPHPSLGHPFEEPGERSSRSSGVLLHSSTASGRWCTAKAISRLRLRPAVMCAQSALHRRALTTKLGARGCGAHHAHARDALSPRPVMKDVAVSITWSTENRVVENRP